MLTYGVATFASGRHQLQPTSTGSPPTKESNSRCYNLPIFALALILFMCGATSITQAAPPTRIPVKIVGLANKCLDAQGGSSENLTPIILFDCHGGPNQLWVITNN